MMKKIATFVTRKRGVVHAIIPTAIFQMRCGKRVVDMIGETIDQPMQGVTCITCRRQLGLTT